MAQRLKSISMSYHYDVIYSYFGYSHEQKYNTNNTPRVCRIIFVQNVLKAIFFDVLESCTIRSPDTLIIWCMTVPIMIRIYLM